ncbi:hypothetical protein M5K25_005042 [Dendrobium thyrsiflorum]|uniref:Uncharacterized protein n=1 Tax=Dendrobium thyrsiflorum TaxID=117978 RepID=A0ABD0VH59_DENTH
MQGRKSDVGAVERVSSRLLPPIRTYRECRGEIASGESSRPNAPPHSIAKGDRAGSCDVRRSTNAPPINVTELPATRPHLGLLSPTSYAHSGFRLRLWRKCAPQAEFTEVYRFEVTFCETPFFGGGGNSLPLLNCTWATSSDSDLFEAVFSSESAIVASGDSPVDSELSSRFTCSIWDAISGSVSSSFGKYKSSSEL